MKPLITLELCPQNELGDPVLVTKYVTVLLVTLFVSFYFIFLVLFLRTLE